jgi:hypothetical protein
MRWVGNVARLGETRSAYRILVGKSVGKRPRGRHWHRWEYNMKHVILLLVSLSLLLFHYALCTVTFSQMIIHQSIDHNWNCCIWFSQVVTHPVCDHDQCCCERVIDRFVLSSSRTFPCYFRIVMRKFYDLLINTSSFLFIKFQWRLISVVLNDMGIWWIYIS